MKLLSLKNLGLTLVGLTLAFFSSAQNNVQQNTRLAQYNLDQEKLLVALKERNLPKITVSPNGRISEAVSITKKGEILYNVTYNIGAGRTLSTNKVWPGGTLGTALTGQNMPNRLGIWDGGAVRLTHQELTGRVNQTDGSQSLSDHATHVAGTMIASGIDADARGMAYMATLKCYDWNSDEFEMEQAALAGMLISNHSYGNIAGWDYNDGEAKWYWYGDKDLSNTEDYKFGYYDDRAAAWDQLAVSYPYYLICKAAGNDRGDNKSGSTWYYTDGTQGTGTPPPSDGGVTGFDCITTYGNAKNILTIGAVQKIGGNTGNGWTTASDVVMSNFSGWGPTDDGRIKPDIVSPGVSIKSSVSTGNTDYDTYNGTSMATPAASGSMLLVQQHYNNIKKSYMRSASLKGLLIHTADEAGNIGPDYKNGWGLMNTASAVKFITDSNFNRLEERILNNAQPQSMQFSVAAGKPLKVTICWTDLPGTPVANNPFDNTTKMLVNDLDIRLKRNSDNTEFKPYILDPANPNLAATTGDNTRDNVEMIFLSAPQAGNYTLTISHKGTLSSPQRYSLLISNGVEKTLALFTSNKTSICPGQSITFTDASTGNVTSRTWYFPGGNPSTSTLPNPTVTYTNGGTYAVALKVIGSLGTDSVYKADYVNVGGLKLPFAENFETNSPTITSWIVDNPDQNVGWESKTIGGTTPGTSAAYINFFNYQSVGERDGIITPALNLSAHTNINLSFKHAYTRYSPLAGTDSLVVYASINCGQTWTRIVGYGENGTGNFATYGNPTNTFGDENEFVPTTANQWCGAAGVSGCKTISLSQFQGQSSVLIKFEGVNGYGNNLFIDNVLVDGTPLPPVAQFEANKTTACTIQAINFSDKSLRSPTTWNWQFSGGTPATSTQKNPVVTYANPGQYKVKLKVTNVGGTDSVEIDNYITVVPPATKPNIKASGATSFCIGDSVYLTTDSAGNNFWYANNVLVATNVAGIYAKDSGTYKVAFSNGYCEVGSTILVDVRTKPNPSTITAAPNTTILCPGATVVLTASNGFVQQWYRNDSLLTAETGKTHQAKLAATYKVVSFAGSCPSEPSNAYTLTPGVQPTVSVITGPDSANRLSNVNYSVQNNSQLQYVWTITNGTILSGNNTNNVSVRFTNQGTGTISVKSKNTTGCLSEAESKQVQVDFAVGLKEVNQENQIKVYPNPANQVLQISFKHANTAETSIKLINILGVTVKNIPTTLQAANQTIGINVADLPSGIYFIEVNQHNQQVRKQILIQH